MEPAHSQRNQHVVEAARLHRARERRDRGRTLAEGPNLLDVALAAGVIPEMVFALSDDDRTAELAGHHGFELILVDQGGLRRVAGTTTPRGPVAVLEIPAGSIGHGPGLLVSWAVSDPGNVGTLIRTAAAFAWDFGYTTGTSDPWSPKVLRAGAGGHFLIGIHQVGSVEDLEKAGYVPVATIVAGGMPPSALGPGRYAVLVGEESSGLPADVVDRSRVKVTIPMASGQESLNAAMAAGMIVYELSKPEGEGEGRV
ncbi:MAG TPA: RNA methyltransferase [Acidimicrobiia bacterium]|jgi:TrmH family RNA methyltransferase